VPDGSREALSTLKPIFGSKLLFFKNGVCQGIAFENLNSGVYYPSISLYMGARVKLNFGPQFTYEPVLLRKFLLNKEAHEEYFKNSHNISQAQSFSFINKLEPCYYIPQLFDYTYRDNCQVSDSVPICYKAVNDAAVEALAKLIIEDILDKVEETCELNNMWL
jgi:hypothetical protein